MEHPEHGAEYCVAELSVTDSFTLIGYGKDVPGALQNLNECLALDVTLEKVREALQAKAE